MTSGLLYSEKNDNNKFQLPNDVSRCPHLELWT